MPDAKVENIVSAAITVEAMFSFVEGHNTQQLFPPVRVSRKNVKRLCQQT